MGAPGRRAGGGGSDGAVRLSIDTPPGWETLREWSEQLMEESLGKGGKGVIVFAPEALADGRARVATHTNYWRSGSGRWPEWRRIFIVEPLIASADATERLAGLAALYLGLQLTMALYGYLWDIPFAGQPAVEAYKARARTLRDSADAELARPVFDGAPLREGRLALVAPERGGPWGSAETPASVLAGWLRAWRAEQALAYLDVTINGEADAGALAALDASLRRLAVERLIYRIHSGARQRRIIRRSRARWMARWAWSVCARWRFSTRRSTRACIQPASWRRNRWRRGKR